ncbi:MAG TPA: hypothetical protein VFS40_15455 [Gemmatimonadales bacterium]|nr:hypothetical protein [Gemmatimonadales bacterium]
MATTDTWRGLGRTLTSGLAGAAALTAVHETARRTLAHPPRMDAIGMRALARTMRRVGVQPPRQRRLFRETLAADLLSNALYYSLVGLGERAWRRGALLGAAAGVGAVVLPPLLGLGRQPNASRVETPALTLAWYLIGGLAAAATARALARREDDVDRWAESL